MGGGAGRGRPRADRRTGLPALIHRLPDLEGQVVASFLPDHDSEKEPLLDECLLAPQQGFLCPLCSLLKQEYYPHKAVEAKLAL